MEGGVDPSFAVTRAKEVSQKTSQNGGPSSPRSSAVTEIASGALRPLESIMHNDEQALSRKIRVSTYKETRRYIINPEESRALRKWDMLMMTVLVFVCFVSPYELAFLTYRQDLGLEWLAEGADWLFWLNRVIDTVFVVDMIFQFFIQYPVQTRYGTLYVSSNRAIAMNYLSSWFCVDAMSIIPFELISIMLSAQNLVRFTVLRSFRLLRLLKLINLVRGFRIFLRWEVELNFSYRRMTLWGLLGTVCLAAHWMSCALGMMSSVQGDFCVEDGDSGCIETWFSPFAREFQTKGIPITPFRTYIACMHVTSTILVHPYSAGATNSFEQACYTMLLFLGGFLWTRVISRTTAVQTSLDRHGISYRQTMDDLNLNSESMMISVQLQRRLRTFFRNMRDSSQRSTWLDLTRRMSPALQGEVAVELHKAWLCRVPYLAGSSRPLVLELARRIQTEHFAQKETFGANFRLYVLNRGLCSRTRGAKAKMRLISPGAVWGAEHMLFKTARLLEPNSATAITFCEVLVLCREPFEQVALDFPENAVRIRKFYVKMVVIRGIIAFANEITEASRRSIKRPSRSGTALFVASEEDSDDDSPLGDHHSHTKRMTHDMNRRVQNYAPQTRQETQHSPVDDWTKLQDILENCVKKQCGALVKAVEECSSDVKRLRKDLEAAGVLPPRTAASL